MSQKKVWLKLILLLTLVIVIVIDLGWGTYQITPIDIINTLLGNGTKMQNTVVFSVRLPRIIIALLVGIALAASGCILQSITRNDLADPSIMGINSGASLAVVLLLSIGSTDYYKNLGVLTIFAAPFAAMAGAFLAAILIYTLAWKKNVSPTRLLLVGIGINAGINAIIILYQLKVSTSDYNRILTWTSGSLWGSNWKFIMVVSPLIIIFFILTLFMHKKMDILHLGDGIAIGLGLSVEKERKKLLFFSVALAGSAVAVAGNIGFLGLIAPHIARKLFGPTHWQLLPWASCIGAIIIILADSFSRNVFSPIEIPAGITISLIGVPYFIYLMSKEA